MSRVPDRAGHRITTVGSITGSAKRGSGLAGGLAAMNRRRGARRNGAFDFDGLVTAAQRLGSFGEEIGRAATAIQRATEGSKASK